MNEALAKRLEESRNVLDYLQGNNDQVPGWIGLDIDEIRAATANALSFCRNELGDDYERIAGIVRGRLPKLLSDDDLAPVSEQSMDGFEVGKLYELNIKGELAMAICVGFHDPVRERMSASELEDGPGSLEMIPYFHLNPNDIGMDDLVIGEIKETIVAGQTVRSNDGATNVADIVLRKELIGFSAEGNPIYVALEPELRNERLIRKKRRIPGAGVLARIFSR